MFKSPRPLSVQLLRLARRSLLVAGLGAFGMVACSQGQGERCEVNRDCKDGLLCLSTGAGIDKTCQAGTTTGTGGSTSATGGSGQTGGSSALGGEGGQSGGGAAGAAGGSNGGATLGGQGGASSEGGASAGSAGSSNGGSGG